MNSQGPRLKNGVDLQLQSAFHDQNWPLVVQLADKRLKALKDQYYEVCFLSFLRADIIAYAGALRPSLFAIYGVRIFMQHINRSLEVGRQGLR